MTEQADTLDAIREAMARDGVQADAALYNEANRLVGERQYAEAARRLEALLALFPGDAQGWLLRAKVHVAQQRWQDALDALTTAEDAGATAPPSLRDTLEKRIEAEQVAPPAPEPVATADVENLKAQLRHARSQNQILVAANRKLERDTNWWAFVAAGIGVVVAILVVVQVRMGSPVAAPTDPLEDGDVPSRSEASGPSTAATLAGSSTSAGSTGSSTPSTTPPAPSSGSAAAPSEGSTGAATPSTPTATVRDPGQAEVAARVLAEAGADNGGQIRVSVRGSKATLVGKATTHTQLRTAIEALEALSSIDEVDAVGVINLARRDGTTYAVAAGDSLSRIAYRHYGDQSLSRHILDGNPQLGGRTNLQIGDRLTIPPVQD